MPELSKHELDKLFRKGAERYDFEYNPTAWERMEAMLDRRRRRVFFWWMAGLAFLILLGGLALCFFCPKAEGYPEKQREQVEFEKAKKPIALQEKTEARQSPEPHPLREAAVQPLPNRLEQEAVYSEGEEALQSREEWPFLLNNGPGQGVKETQPPSVNPINPQNQKKHDLKETDNAGLPRIKMREDAFRLVPLPAHLLPPRAEKASYREAPDISFPSKWEGSYETSSHLVFGPMLSAGMFSVGWGDFSRGGWKAGIFAEYQYNGRFALGLGASFLRMNYLAGKGEYIPPKGFWTRRIAPESTRGLCNVLEVPVMLKYYSRGYSGNGPFFSAGLASYLLLMEEYWYRYSAEEPDLIRWWQTDKGQAHWFAIAQLSAGYQAAIGKRWALQAGPYLQVPLAGVGHGHVKLYSLGLEVRLARKIW